MTLTSVSISPLNSLIFIHGSNDWQPPKVEPERGMVWATPSCVVSACFPELDGQTRIVLATNEATAQSFDCAFDGMLETPKRAIDVTTVGSAIPILQLAVLDTTTRIRVWHSHPIWPKIVTIGCG